MVAASVILAIRTAKWNSTIDEGLHNRDWEQEIDRALRMARNVIDAATAKWPENFHRNDVPWYDPEDAESPKIEVKANRQHAQECARISEGEAGDPESMAEKLFDALFSKQKSPFAFPEVRSCR